jgi:hypothetical protein
MAKVAKRSVEFKVTTKVQVRAPEFEPLRSLAALDTDRLSRGNHKIEIGFVKGGCCRNLVRAIVKNGRVTGCEIEPCDETTSRPPSSDFRRVLEKARKKLTGGKKWQPIPVTQLVRSNNRQLIDLIIVGGGCFFICIWSHCLMCCWHPFPHCFVPDIYTGPL